MREPVTEEYERFSAQVKLHVKELFNETIFQENAAYTPVRVILVAPFLFICF